jgi:predicted nucleic acid-binding protein
MNVECFLDTNIIVYAAAGRGADEWKRIRAFELLEPAEFGLSGQVLQEFYVTVTTKARVKLGAREAAEWVDRLSFRPVAPIDDSIVKEAISLSVRYQISYWDAALIAAARSLDTRLLYTEDLNHGQFYADVQVVNPFLPS